MANESNTYLWFLGNQNKHNHFHDQEIHNQEIHNHRQEFFCSNCHDYQNSHSWATKYHEETHNNNFHNSLPSTTILPVRRWCRLYRL